MLTTPSGSVGPLYGREPTPRDYLGGSDARMLLDAAAELERLRRAAAVTDEWRRKASDHRRQRDEARAENERLRSGVVSSTGETARDEARPRELARLRRRG